VLQRGGKNQNQTLPKKSDVQLLPEIVAPARRFLLHCGEEQKSQKNKKKGKKKKGQKQDQADELWGGLQWRALTKKRS
jgi:hypothetical protein